MQRYRLLVLIIMGFVSLVAFAVTANAQVYKCTSGKDKTAYSDKPCSIGSSQTVTDIAAPVNADTADAKADNDSRSSLTRQMDDAVKTAIANDDLIRAQALATSKEQRSWVNTAKKEAAQKIAANNAASPSSKASSYECRQARANLDRVSDSNVDAGVINAKTSLMQAACGEQYQVSGYGGAPSPYLSYPYPNRGGYPHHGSYPNQGSYPYPGQYPHDHGNSPGITTQPYDRTIEPNFGSRFVRP